jgi:hypothetical protein
MSRAQCAPLSGRHDLAFGSGSGRQDARRSEDDPRRALRRSGGYRFRLQGAAQAPADETGSRRSRTSTTIASRRLARRSLKRAKRRSAPRVRRMTGAALECMELDSAGGSDGLAAEAGATWEPVALRRMRAPRPFLQ